MILRVTLEYISLEVLSSFAALGMKSDHRRYVVGISSQRHWSSSQRSLLVPRSLSHRCTVGAIQLNFRPESNTGFPNAFLQTHFRQVRFVARSPSYCRRIRELALPGIEISRWLQRFRPEPSGLAAVVESPWGTALWFLTSWYGSVLTSNHWLSSFSHQTQLTVSVYSPRNNQMSLSGVPMISRSLKRASLSKESKAAFRSM